MSSRFVGVGTEFFPCGQADGQIDMTKVIVAFRNFANAPVKNDDSSAIATMFTKRQFYAVQPLKSSVKNVVIFIKRRCIQLVITAALLKFAKLL